MSDVKLFVSHSERDMDFAIPLTRWLQNGLGLDDDQIRCTSMQGLQNKIRPAETLRSDLLCSKVIVGLLTSNSLSSHWAQMEMGAGWLDERLQPIRGPGVTRQDLPAPHNEVITASFLEIVEMNALLADIAKDLDVAVNHGADKLLDDMISDASKALKNQRMLWYSLPPILSAWSLNKDEYSKACAKLCEALHLNDAEVRDVKGCVAPWGALISNPESLPQWAKKAWGVSKVAVNFMLDPVKLDPGSIRLPRDTLTTTLMTDLETALTAKNDQPKLMQDWFENARECICEDLPASRSSHGHR